MERASRYYVELQLCLCVCGSRGLVEGELNNLNLDDEYLAQRYFAAMHLAIESLEHRSYSGLRIARGHLVEELSDADSIIEFCLQNFPNSQRVIRLLRCGDGALTFFLNIRFNNFETNNINLIIDHINDIVVDLMEAGFAGCSVDWTKVPLWQEMKRVMTPEKFSAKLSDLELENWNAWREQFDIYENGKKTSIRWR